MNRTDIERYKAMLEAKRVELSAGSDTGKTSLLKKHRTPWMKCNSPESAN